MRIILFFLAATLWMVVPTPFAQAAEIRVIASPALSAALNELGPYFERATGNKLAVRYGLIAAQKEQIDVGDFDLAIVPAVVLDDAMTRGKIASDTRAAVALVGLGVGILAGSPKPDLTSTNAFKTAMLGAHSVSYVTNEPTGAQIAEGFERLGIGAAMKAKTKSQGSVSGVWQSVASGEVEFGFGLSSNILSVPAVEVAGYFPSELQHAITLVAGVAIAARQADAAKMLLKYLRGVDAIAVMKTRGLVPPEGL